MKDIQEAIARKRAEVQKLEDAVARLEEAKRDLAALERAAAILGVEELLPSPKVRISPRSAVGLTIEILREAEEPFLHVDKLVEKLAEKGIPATKNSLASSLAKYARQGRIFFRGPEPNTFGLIERNPKKAEVE